MKKQHKTLIQYIIVVLLVIAGCSITIVSYWGTIIPFFQTTHYLSYVERKGPLSEVALSNILSTPDIFTPYTPYQSDIRSNLLGKTIALSAIQKVDTAYVEKVITLVQEDLEKNPAQAEKLADIAQAYLLLARMDSNNQTLLAKAKTYYEDALVLWPDSQNILFAYVAVLVNQGNFIEAERIANHVISLDDGFGLSYYYRGFVYLRKGPQYYEQALTDFSQSIESVGTKGDSLKAFYQILFTHFYQRKNIEKVTEVVTHLIAIDSEQAALYKNILSYIEKNNSLPTIRFN